MDPVFLSLDEVLEIHEQQIDRYGGSPGLRDAARLGSKRVGANAAITLLFMNDWEACCPEQEDRVPKGPEGPCGRPPPRLGACPHKGA